MTTSEPGIERLAEERLRLLVEHSPDLLSLYDRRGRFSWASATHERILGFTVAELVGRDPLDFVHPDDAERVAVEMAGQLAALRPAAPVEFRFRCRDGRYRWFEASAVDLTDDAAVGGILVASRDVTDRHRAEAAVHAQADVLERIARGAPLDQLLDRCCLTVEQFVEGARAVVLDQRRSRPRVAAAPTLEGPARAGLERAAGLPEVRERLGRGPVFGSIAGTSERVGFERVSSVSGLTGWWAAPIRSSDGDRLFGSITVLTRELREPDAIERGLLASLGTLAALAIERDSAHAHLEYQASHDSLTGLPNREALREHLRDLTVPRPGRVGAVLFLDLDRFKVHNDSAGHAVGDRILVEVARRLELAVRDGDLVARFAGDEFVVALSGCSDVDEVVSVAERVLDVVSRPIRVDDHEVVVSASIGAALVDGRSPEALLRDADTAMYYAKERGRARVELFDGRLRTELLTRLEIERELRRALDEGGLVLHYQPVMSFRTGRFSGFEALIRWEHPRLGVLAPARFLDVAEEAGLMVRLGQQVQQAAFEQWSEWRRAHPEWGEFVVGVNLSAAELRDPTLPARVAEVVATTGADPRLITFEVSERVLAADTDAAEAVLRRLHAMGVLIAVDDFGTGTSPLLHLRRFPIHLLKVDAELVSGLGVHREDAILVSEVIRLAHRLGLFAVAEGVEHHRQAVRLRRYGCLLGQGHFFAPAMPAAAVPAWVAGHGLNRSAEDLLR